MDAYEFFKNDRFATDNGMKILSIKEGKADVYIEIKEKHLNAGNYVQGGVIFTLADFAIAIAANSYGKLAVSLTSNIQFFRSASLGDIITAKAEVEFNHRQVPAYKANVYNQNNDLIAVCNGNMYVKDISINLTY